MLNNDSESKRGGVRNDASCWMGVYVMVNKGATANDSES